MNRSITFVLAGLSCHCRASTSRRTGRSTGVKDQSCDSQPSNYNNFMDYSGCRKMFTKGQVTRMRENLFAHRPGMVENSR